MGIEGKGAGVASSSCCEGRASPTPLNFQLTSEIDLVMIFKDIQAKPEICVCTRAFPFLDKSCAQVPVGLAHVSVRA